MGKMMSRQGWWLVPLLVLGAVGLVRGATLEEIILAAHRRQPFGRTFGWVTPPGLPTRGDLLPLRQRIRKEREKGNEAKARVLEELLPKNTLTPFQEAFLDAGETDSDRKRFEILERLRQQEPDNRFVLYNLAGSLLSLGQPQKAAATLRQVVERTPNWPEAWNNLGVALVRGGRLDEGERAFTRGLALASQTPELLYNHACVAWKRGQRDEAHARAERLRQVDSTSARHMANRLHYFIDRAEAPGDDATTIADGARKTSSTKEDELLTTFERRLAESADRQPFGVTDSWRPLAMPDGLGRHGQASLSLWLRAKEEAEGGLRFDRLPHAQAALERLQALGTDAAVESIIRYDLAWIHLRARRYGEAAEAFRSVVERDATDVQAWNNLGVALVRSGRTAEGKQAFGEGLRIAPDDPHLLYNLGTLALLAGDHPEARRIAAALERFPRGRSLGSQLHSRIRFRARRSSGR